MGSTHACSHRMGIRKSQRQLVLVFVGCPDLLFARPQGRDVFDGAADPVVIYSGVYGRWYMYYTNRRAKAEGTKAISEIGSKSLNGS